MHGKTKTVSGNYCSLNSSQPTSETLKENAILA